jgi:hypothetical protein
MKQSLATHIVTKGIEHSVYQIYDEAETLPRSLSDLWRGRVARE